MTPNDESDEQKKAEASYVAAVLKLAAFFGFVSFFLLAIGNEWHLHEQHYRYLMIAVLVGGFTGFIMTAREKNEFIFFVCLGFGLWGGVIFASLPFFIALLADLGAWLIGKPQPIADLQDISWKFYPASGIFFGGVNALGTLRTPGAVLSYGREAGSAAILGTISGSVITLAQWTGPPPELPEIVGFLFGVMMPAFLKVGIPLAGIWVVGLSIYRRGFPRGLFSGSASVFDGVANLAAAIGNEGAKLAALAKGALWLAYCVVLVFVGRWFLSMTPLIGLWEILGWCAIGADVIAFFKALREIGPALRSSQQLQNQGVHGDARLATPEEGKSAARGEPRSSPAIDPRKLNY